jgi:hypothetical protein
MKPIFDSTRLQVLSNKLLSLFPPTRYDPQSKTVTINTQSFVIPKKESKVLSIRTTLTR